MAKMTIKGVVYEGTPEELREIVRPFEEVEDVAGFLEKGDIVRATENFYGVRAGELGVVTKVYESNRLESDFGDGRPLYARVELVARAKDRVDTE